MKKQDKENLILCLPVLAAFMMCLPFTLFIGGLKFVIIYVLATIGLTSFIFIVNIVINKLYKLLNN